MQELHSARNAPKLPTPNTDPLAGSSWFQQAGVSEGVGSLRTAVLFRLQRTLGSRVRFFGLRCKEDCKTPSGLHIRFDAGAKAGANPFHCQPAHGAKIILAAGLICKEMRLGRFWREVNDHGLKIVGQPGGLLHELLHGRLNNANQVPMIVHASSSTRESARLALKNDHSFLPVKISASAPALKSCCQFLESIAQLPDRQTCRIRGFRSSRDEAGPARPATLSLRGPTGTVPFFFLTRAARPAE